MIFNILLTGLPRAAPEPGARQAEHDASGRHGETTCFEQQASLPARAQPSLQPGARLL